MLTELQRLLIRGLCECKLDTDTIMVILQLLEDEQQQWQMEEYLHTVIENPPDRTIVFKKAVEIAGLLEEK